MQNQDHSEDGTVKIWDPIVRAGHWILVVGFFTAWLSGDEWLTGHVWAGYIVAGVVLVRIVWGFIGTRYARFSNFVYGPKTIFSYSKAMLTGTSKRYLGHNPLGGLMIVLMMLCLLMLSVSGVVLLALEEDSGPLAGVVYPQLSAHSVESAEADDDDEGHGSNAGAESGAVDDGRFEQVEDFWEEMHEILTNIMLLLVGLHIAGVALSSLKHRENLVCAMINGRKRV